MSVKLTYKQTTTLDILEDNSKDCKTEIIYGGSAGSALGNNIPPTTLRGKLNGTKYNNTSFRYLY